ncbi:MAG: ATP-binding protein [Clostridia bacterium]|nr:ATP-binding protein [Clostridia bacterium]MBQ2387680.1 ATP-binding protein [Clostridia bacterium]MBQ5598383.1 ATP-binding protein [Clostridia bacterium]
MSESVKLSFPVLADDFSHAGEASGSLKRTLKKLGIDMEVIRRVSIAVYEGEINMVIHADGGVIDAEISAESIEVWLRDKGPGIKDVELAMQEGYSTARDHIRALGFGAGMGLPNIKKYTDEMSIETEIGVGTTVYLKVNIT